MAEVLSPPTTPSSTITMLHNRPSSADAFNSSTQQYPQASPRLGQQPARSVYHGQNTGYRGTTATPVQPYAFQSTPNLRQDTRSASNPAAHAATSSQRHVHTQSQQSASTCSTASTDASSAPSAKDDSVIGSRNSSLINLSASIPDLSLISFDQPAKPSPNRYRRPEAKKAESGNTTPKPTTPTSSVAPSGSGMASVGHLLPPALSPPRQGSLDDMAVKTGTSESAKRYRRRSANNIDTAALQATAGAQRPSSSAGAASTHTTIRPVSVHSRSGSDDSRSSQRKSESSAQENDKPATGLRPVHVPLRTSSEAHKDKRSKAPSPLSKETDQEQTPAVSPQKAQTYAAAAQAGVYAQSPAAQQLAAVSDKDLNKGMKSRLRRAFSFGSAQELRRSAAENSGAAYDPAAQNAQHTREQHQQHIDDELDAEQQAIARQQEASGLGNSIYANTAVALTGSTDNISISSTASSASMMLRKMGRGAKRGARSIKGLFRPKSVIGVPAADGPMASQGAATVSPSVGGVSMVTVEAERQRVNVDAHPTAKHGVTGFPRLERNSTDAANSAGLAVPPARASADRSDSLSRRSIVGSDKDRAEVLAAVKKGILKKTGTASPNGSPVMRPNDGSSVPTISESPASSVPSTPKDGQSRTESMQNNINGDYFSPRLVPMAKSMPNTPNGSARGISFSPRIQFHDVWSSTEYDRRGEIATCNRLTPTLAQQIKEELNTFKMEMEVHELSKPHTHFF